MITIFTIHISIVYAHQSHSMFTITSEQMTLIADISISIADILDVKGSTSLRTPHLPFLQVLIKGFGVHLTDLCNTSGSSLEDFVTIRDVRVSNMVQQIICMAPGPWLNQAERHFLGNLDFLKPIKVRNESLRVQTAKRL